MANKTQKSIIDLKDKTLIQAFHNHLLRYGGFKLTGFGVFDLKKMKAHKGFNPYTKKVEHFPEYIKITFTPNKFVKELIQKWK